MACMEHVCRECGWTTFDNNPRSRACPKCGSTDFSHFCDEEPDRDEERGADEDE